MLILVVRWRVWVPGGRGMGVIGARGEVAVDVGEDKLRGPLAVVPGRLLKLCDVMVLRNR